MIAPSPGAAAGARRSGVVLKGYPRLSETFIAQELAALERRGVAVDAAMKEHIGRLVAAATAASDADP